MLDSKLYNGCSAPRYVYSKAAGRVVYCECGKCAYCISKRARRSNMRIQFNARKYKYCYFCSLDFAPKYLPLMRAYVLDREYDCEVVDGHLFDSYRDDVIPFSRWSGSKDEYVTILLKQVRGSVPYDNLSKKYVPLSDTFRMTPSQFRELLQRVQPTTDSRLPQDCIPFANYLEFQKFFKRLKINHKRLCPSSNETISYYIVTEYGPKTLRPHCHILLFFNEECTAKAIQQICIKSWKFGRVDISSASGKSITYVSGYANSVVSLPLAYRTSKVFKVRSRSSVGFDSMAEVPSPSYENEVEEFNKDLLYGVVASSNGKSCTLVPSSTVVRALYPRYKGYALSDAEQTARILLSCRRAINTFGFDCSTWNINSVAEYARYLYNYLKDIVSESIHQPYIKADDIELLLAADLVNEHGFLYSRYDLDDIGIKSIGEPYDIDEFLFKRVYRLCLTCFNFFRLWHEPSFDYHSLSRFLQRFYDMENNLRYHRLADYFAILERDYESDKVPFHAIARYRSTSKVLDCENTDFVTNRLFRDLEQINNSILASKMKHKKLNDLLGIWLNNNNML